MSPYVPLKKFAYQYPALLQDEIKHRSKGLGTVRLAFDKDQYFYVLVPELLSQCEKIMLNEYVHIPQMLANMPEHSHEFLLQNLLVKEIQATHAIEGIHSTRREVEEALSTPAPTNAKRFNEFVAVLRAQFGNSAAQQINTLEKIRALYDQAAAHENESGTELDGRLFRKGNVHVYSETQKVLHTGFHPEEKIHQGLEAMLREAEKPTSNTLISAIVCHFMFETIHPFYDGNGRTGRVLLGYHLRKALTPLSILSLSQAIADEKTSYYNALKEARDPRNYGEITHYILDMLGMLNHGQEILLGQLLEAQECFAYMETRLPALTFETYSARQQLLMKQILTIAAEHYAFGTDLGVSLDLLAEMIPRIPRRTLSKACDRLVNAGYLRQTKARPKMLTLSQQAARELMQ